MNKAMVPNLPPWSYAHPDRAEPNTLESYGLRVTILMAVSILSR